MRTFTIYSLSNFNMQYHIISYSHITQLTSPWLAYFVTRILYILTPFHPLSLATTIVVLWICDFVGIVFGRILYISDIIWYLSFLIWLISLSIMSSNSLICISNGQDTALVLEKSGSIHLLFLHSCTLFSSFIQTQYLISRHQIKSKWSLKALWIIFTHAKLQRVLNTGWGAFQCRDRDHCTWQKDAHTLNSERTSSTFQERGGVFRFGVCIFNEGRSDVWKNRCGWRNFLSVP